MHTCIMSNENAEHVKFLRRFSSLLGSTSQLFSNGGSCLLSDTRQTRESVRKTH